MVILTKTSLTSQIAYVDIATGSINFLVMAIVIVLAIKN